MTSINKRIIGLDLLRSIALFMAVFGHCATLFNPLIHLPIVGNLIGKTLALHEIIAFSGVEIFFVLSGFLIADILFKYFNNTQNHYPKYYLFLIRRWLRTLPNYYLLLLINIILYVWILKEQPFDWRFLFFIQNLNYPPTDFYRESWSLATEEWFYFLFPLVLIILQSYKTFSFKQNVLLTCTLFLLFSIALKTIHILQYGADIDFDGNIRKVTLLRFDNLILGILCYTVFYFYRPFFFKYKNILLGLGILLFIVSVVSFYAAFKNNFLLYHHQSSVAFLCNYCFLLALGLAFTFVIPKLYQLNLDKYQYFSAFIKKTSQLSYSIYLINLPLYKLLFFRNNLLPDSIGSSFLFILLFIAINYSIAFIIYQYFELPFLKFRDEKFPNLY